MVPSAALKVFQPLAAFEPEERAYWERYATAGPVAQPAATVLVSRERGLGGATATLTAEREHAEILERRGAIFVCPHRTRLRILASVLAFRRSVPPEVVGAFLPAGDVERAAEEIDRLRAAHPGWRNHILLSAWEVPLRWFVLFDDAEREPAARRSLRYETVMRAARERAARALRVLRGALPNPAVVGPLRDLARWLGEFAPGSLVALDYGSLGDLLSAEAIREDRSCREIWAAIRALEEGDLEGAGAHYLVAAERWSSARNRQHWN